MHAENALCMGQMPQINAGNSDQPRDDFWPHDFKSTSGPFQDLAFEPVLASRTADLLELKGR